MKHSGSRMTRERWLGYGVALGGTTAATAVFWLARTYLDKGQASLLYLPVVIACAVRFGFGPAAAGAMFSFLCWNFFFLPPYHTLTVANSRDWLALIIFLIAAMSTAQLAAQARLQADEAQVREQETLTLYQASEAISSEIAADRLLPALAERIRQACGAGRCVILRGSPPDEKSSLEWPVAAAATDVPLSPEDQALIERMARTACEHNQVIGFGEARHLWAKAAGSEPGAYVPLRAGDALVGALSVSPRRDKQPFSAQDQRLILALASHAAVVIARQTLAEEAAQATALREADTLKEALLSLVSHELRTPLAAIKAAASGLRQQETVWPEAARAQAIATIDTEADRLTVLVSNLLDLSRLEAGAWKPSRDWCDLNEILGTVLDHLPERDAARVRVDAAEDLPLIRADYVQIVLVLTNLLQNAAKYTPSEQPIQVTVSEASSEAAPGVRVDVRDFGAGISPGDEEAIFTRFHRSARHVNSTVHGTGLGLALCRAIVEAHGGRIWASNAPPGTSPGAILSFFLPVE